MSMISVSSGAAARGLPVFLPSTEAAADATTFVCEFTGGAGANETGAGLGLTGADLVLPAFGAPPAASGSPSGRALTGPQGFNCTSAMLAAWATGSEWTLAIKARSLTPAASRQLFWILSNAGSYSKQFNLQINTVLRFLANLNTQTVMPATGMTTTASPGWIVCWWKANVLHVGWVIRDDIPTHWDDFPANQRAAVRGADFSNAAPFTVLEIIGGAGANGFQSVDMTVCTLVCSKLGIGAMPEIS